MPLPRLSIQIGWPLAWAILAVSFPAFQGTCVSPWLSVWDEEGRC